MSTPNEPIETTTARVWLDGGILFMQSTGAESTYETVQGTLRAFEQLTEGERVPLLADARIWPGGDAEAWTHFIKLASEMFTAVATVIDPENAPEMGGYPDIVDRLIVPFRVFTEMHEAVAFLEQFRPD